MPRSFTDRLILAFIVLYKIFITVLFVVTVIGIVWIYSNYWGIVGTSCVGGSHEACREISKHHQDTGSWE